MSRRLRAEEIGEKKRFNGSIEEADAFAGIDDEMINFDEREKQFKRMGTGARWIRWALPQHHRRFYIKDLSMEEISVKFGYTNADNAKNQKYKCLQRWRNYFDDKKKLDKSWTRSWMSWSIDMWRGKANAEEIKLVEAKDSRKANSFANMCKIIKAGRCHWLSLINMLGVEK